MVGTNAHADDADADVAAAAMALLCHRHPTTNLVRRVFIDDRHVNSGIILMIIFYRKYILPHNSMRRRRQRELMLGFDDIDLMVLVLGWWLCMAWVIGGEAIHGDGER